MAFLQFSDQLPSVDISTGSLSHIMHVLFMSQVPTGCVRIYTPHMLTRNTITQCLYYRQPYVCMYSERELRESGIGLLLLSGLKFDSITAQTCSQVTTNQIGVSVRDLLEIIMLSQYSSSSSCSSSSSSSSSSILR